MKLRLPQYRRSKIHFLFILLMLLCVAPSYPETHSDVLVNRRMAEKLNLKAGDLIEIAPTGDMKNFRTYRIGGIYEEQADPFLVPLKRSFIKMHLSDLEDLSGKNDKLDLISIQIRTGTDPRRLAARLNADSIGFTAYSAQELADRSSTTFVVVSKFHEAIALISMAAGAIFIFALMVMRVEDQRKNLAILTVTGISKRTILKSLMLEAVFFAFFATLIGSGIGAVSAKFVNLYYQYYYQTTLIFAQVTPGIFIRAVCISFLLGIIAGTFSWFRLRHLAVLQELGR